MTDLMTKKRLLVSTEGTAGPYIFLPESQLDEVQRLLDSHHIRYWVGENAISMDGGPFTTIINLGRGGDAKAVQTLLDSVR